MRVGRGARQAAADVRGRAVVDEGQAALLQLVLEHVHRRRRLHELRAEIVGDAEVPGRPRQQPLQALGGFLGLAVGHQSVGAGIVVGIVLRLHRRFEQHLVAGGPGHVNPALQAVGIGHERQGDLGRQVGDRLARGLGVEAEAADDQGHLRLAVAGEGTGVGLERHAAVGTNHRQHAAGALREQARDRRLSQPGAADGLGRIEPGVAGDGDDRRAAVVDRAGLGQRRIGKLHGGRAVGRLAGGLARQGFAPAGRGAGIGDVGQRQPHHRRAPPWGCRSGSPGRLRRR